jgi:formylglycine-generating enzyme required for sulfatase activity
MKKLGYFLLLLPVLFAFGRSKKPQTSKYLTKSYVKVPAGYLYTNVKKNIENGKIIGDNFFNKQMTSLEKDSCSEFYISSTEVTNNNWKEFLTYLKQEGRMDEYNANLLDTMVWRSRLAYNEPYVKYYYQHPAYKEYPVVGMTLKQANAYASWLTEIYSLKNQGVKITFSVPTKKQWIRAARGETPNTYPWGGPYMRNSKGVYLTNFKDYDAGDIHFNRETNKYEVISSICHTTSNNHMEPMVGMTITAPSESYYPNEFGIYNMSGNVAELVSDDTVAMGGSWDDTGYDVRVESEQPATEAKSTIGFRVVAVIE